MYSLAILTGLKSVSGVTKAVDEVAESAERAALRLGRRRDDMKGDNRGL